MSNTSEMSDEEMDTTGLAATRDRRSNAGARMAKLLEAEDEDEFYKTTYGGFNEEEDDDDYQSENSLSDDTDSDIDIDEQDELKSDAEDDGSGPKRTKRLVTKAYKEPKKESASTKASQPKPKQTYKRPEKIEIIDRGRKTVRQSTAEKSRSTVDAVKEREAKAALLKTVAEKKKLPSVRRLTQEELLAEAMITEQINLKSLEMYQRLELEKKRSKVHRPTHRGPMIRYRSVTESIESEAGTLLTEESTTNSLISELPSDSQNDQLQNQVEKCSRNFVSFSDDSLYRQFFPPSFRRARSPVQKSYCIVTGLPARYFDPLTQSPYATVEAFKVLREAYTRHLEEQDDLT